MARSRRGVMVESVASESALPSLGGWNAVGFPICLDPISLEKTANAATSAEKCFKYLNIIENPFGIKKFQDVSGRSSCFSVMISSIAGQGLISEGDVEESTSTAGNIGAATMKQAAVIKYRISWCRCFFIFLMGHSFACL